MKGILFLLGSCGYPVIELAWRGHTHYSMALAGGVCLCLIDQVCCEKLSGKSLHMRCAAGSGIITGVELALGHGGELLCWGCRCGTTPRCP